jgi:hypothetical protein
MAWKWSRRVVLFGVMAPLGAAGLLMIGAIALHKFERTVQAATRPTEPVSFSRPIVAPSVQAAERVPPTKLAQSALPEPAAPLGATENAPLKAPMGEMRPALRLSEDSEPAAVRSRPRDAAALKSTAPYASLAIAPMNEAGRSSGPRVFIHFRADADDATVEVKRIASRLRGIGVASVKFRAVADTPRVPNIRYFFADDATASRKIAAELTGTGRAWQVRDFTAYRIKPQHGTIEIWIPTSRTAHTASDSTRLSSD